MTLPNNNENDTVNTQAKCQQLVAVLGNETEEGMEFALFLSFLLVLLLLLQLVKGKVAGRPGISIVVTIRQFWRGTKNVDEA